MALLHESGLVAGMRMQPAASPRGRPQPLRARLRVALVYRAQHAQVSCVPGPMHPHSISLSGLYGFARRGGGSTLLLVTPQGIRTHL